MDSRGRIISEHDETGENKTEYVYYDNTDKVRETIYPNGTKVCSDNLENVSTITQSTIDGEANSTQSYYTHGLLTKVKSNDFVVDYEYEQKKRLSKVSFNGEKVFDIVYTDGVSGANDIARKDFAPRGTDNLADIFQTETDNKGNIISVKYANCEVDSTSPSYTTQKQCTYNTKGNPTQIVDSVASVTHMYTYDSFDRLTKHGFGSNSTDYVYNSFGNLQTKTHKLYKAYYAGQIQTDNIDYAYTYSDDSRQRLTQMSVGSVTENYTYDALERSKKISQTINGNIISKDYGYYKNGDHATNLINSVFYKKNGAVTDREHYTYDNMGNVISISKNGNKLKEYKYDTLGRIVYENNIDIDREISYTYDKQGNILSKTDNGIKIDYAYDECGFKLLAYGGYNYNYDNLGNPLNLNSTYYNASWTKAHLLTTLYASSHNVNFTYDGSGLLRGLSIAGSMSSYTYTYEDGKLIRQTYNNTTHTDFLYGKEGLLGFIYNGETYLYQKNVFGDIVKVLDSTGQVVAEYSYTAFGECTIVTNVNNIAGINPFRYRGYFLESNSGLYYLKSRFYNPITGRFISPDDTKYLQPDTINGLNLYAYCRNNPLMYLDPDGSFAISIGIGSIIAIAAILIGGSALIAAEAETHVISNAVNGVVDFVGDAVETIGDVVKVGYDEIKDIVKEFADTLQPKNWYNGTERHHIVAKKDYRAWISRLFLRASGIDINDNRNLVDIKNGYHRVLHTNTYYFLLNASMFTGYVFGGSDGVEKVLSIFKNVLGGL